MIIYFRRYLCLNVCIFKASILPYLLVLPQILVTLVFFMWPASQAFYQSFLIEDAFGFGSEFVWFENYEYLWSDSHYLAAFKRTAVFSVLVAVLSMSVALILAGFADRVIKGAGVYPHITHLAICRCAWYWQGRYGCLCSTQHWVYFLTF